MAPVGTAPSTARVPPRLARYVPRGSASARVGTNTRPMNPGAPVTDEWPGGWVAHHYTRYLGDLAGGQAVRGLLERTYGVTGNGARFYDVAALGPVPRFRTHYRALLDAVTTGDAEWARAAMTTHVLDGRDLLLAHLDTVGLWSPEETAPRDPEETPCP